MDNQLINYLIIVAVLFICYKITLSIKKHEQEQESPLQNRPRSKSKNKFFEFCYANGKRLTKSNIFFARIIARIDSIGKIRLLYCFFILIILLHFIDPINMEKYFFFLLFLVQPQYFVLLFVGLLIIKAINVPTEKANPRSLFRDFTLGIAVLVTSPLLLYFSTTMSQ